MSEPIIEVGRYAVFIDDRWTKNPPFKRGVEIVAINKKVKVSFLDRFGCPQFRLLRKEEIIQTFENETVATAVAIKAYERHKEMNDRVNSAIAERDAKTKEILKALE